MVPESPKDMLRMRIGLDFTTLVQHSGCAGYIRAASLGGYYSVVLGVALSTFVTMWRVLESTVCLACIALLLLY